MRQIKIGQSITNRQGDSLERYLQEISREPMISTDEEVRLASLIKKGDDEALGQLVRANLRFVVSVAKQYQGQGLNLTDLINEGNVGLITAAKRFDETRGFKFISYAVWWIRQSILQALAEQSRLVRIPSNQVGIMSKVNQFIHQYVQTHEHRPTIGEICDALDLDPERVQNAIESYGHHISVDAPLVDDDQSSLLDVLSSNEADTEEKNLIYESLANELERSLATLPDRERTIVKMFFGIGYSEKSLEEIGEEIGLSRERVRQIKEKALRLLRESSNTPVLRSYLG